MANPECPLCFGEGELLGTMGEVIHYRCRQCGTQFSKPADKDKPDEVQKG